MLGLTMLVVAWARWVRDLLDAEADVDRAAALERLRALSALPPPARRDEVTERSVDGTVGLLADICAVGAGCEDPWRVREEAGLLGDALEAVVAAVAVDRDPRRTEAQRVLRILTAQTHLLRGIAADATGHREEAHRHFSLAAHPATAAVDPVSFALGGIGAALTDEDAGQATAARPPAAAQELLAPLEELCGAELPELREAVTTRCEAYEQVRAASDEPDENAAATTLTAWLRQRGPGAGAELWPVWMDTLTRRLHEETIEEAQGDDGVGRVSADGGLGRVGVDDGLGRVGVDGGSGPGGADGGPGRGSVDGGPGQVDVDGEPGRVGVDGEVGRASSDGGLGRVGVDSGSGLGGAAGGPGPVSVDGELGRVSADGGPGQVGMDGGPDRGSVDGELGPDGGLGRVGVDGGSGLGGEDEGPGQVSVDGQVSRVGVGGEPSRDSTGGESGCGSGGGESGSDSTGGESGGGCGGGESGRDGGEFGRGGGGGVPGRGGVRDGTAAWAGLGDRVLAGFPGAVSFRWVLAVHLRERRASVREIQVLTDLLADDPDDRDAVRFLARAYAAADRLDDAVALLRSRIADPPVPDDEPFVELIVLLLSGRMHPEAARWDEELARITGGRRVNDALPSAGNAPAPPAPQPVFAVLEDGKLLIDPQTGNVPPGEIRTQIWAAMIAGSPDWRRTAAVPG
ncbi:hypothetical protein RB200_36755 [Streptomyces sp. PmtG]